MELRKRIDMKRRLERENKIDFSVYPILLFTFILPVVGFFGSAKLLFIWGMISFICFSIIFTTSLSLRKKIKYEIEYLLKGIDAE